MSLMTWTKEQFGTSVTQHDQEHQKIFSLVNALHDSAAGSDKTLIGSHLDALINYVAEHFGNEEKNMQKINYTGYDSHKQEHDKLVQTCVDLQQNFRAGKAEVTQATTTYIRDWLVHHIPTIDRNYGPIMNGAGIA